MISSPWPRSFVSTSRRARPSRERIQSSRPPLAARNSRKCLTDVVSKTGEKMQVGDYARFQLDGPGIIGMYVHFNKKVGSMLLIEADSEQVAHAPAIKQAASDFAMHITASKPMALDPSSLDPETVEKEKAIYARTGQEQAPRGGHPHRGGQAQKVL